jgi:hypothetical protein
MWYIHIGLKVGMWAETRQVGARMMGVVYVVKRMSST